MVVKKTLRNKLARPIRLDPPPGRFKRALVGDEAALAEWKTATLLQRMAGDISAWTALFEHYDIPKPHDISSLPKPGNDPWKSLAIALARDYVPGVTTTYAPKKKPRAMVWPQEKQLALLFAVEGERARRTILSEVKSEREACRRLAMHDPWKDGKQGASLYQRLAEAKKSDLAWMLSQARKHGQEIPGLVSEVEQKCRSIAQSFTDKPASRSS